jgi:hypothetical protein
MNSVGEIPYRPVTLGTSNEILQIRKGLAGCDFELTFDRMNWTSRCAVVIPCLNEARNIAAVVASVRQLVPTVFVIDDGSQDDTGMIAKKAGAKVIRNVSSQGKGAALQIGWRHAHTRGFDWALAMDGDGQHSPNDVPRFFDVAERTGAKLVIGNRMGDPKGMPWVRRWVNRWMSKRISALAGMSLPDSQCGFRLMNLGAWNRLRVEASHFEIESEVLLAFARSGDAIEFAPIEVIYKSEQSKIHPVRDTVRWVSWWRRAERGRLQKRDGAVGAFDIRCSTSNETAGKMPAAGYSSGQATRDSACVDAVNHGSGVGTMSDVLSSAPGVISRRQRILKRIFSFLLVAVCVGFFFREASISMAKSTGPAGFGRGMLQGAMMPGALPNLLVGNDVVIYAPNNTGRTYKLGYTCGVNACGAIFFGWFFWRVSKWRRAGVERDA